MSALEEAKQRLPLPALLAQLGLAEHAKKSAKCPFHEDRSNSFSVFQGAQGEWAWNCFASCGGGDEPALLARIENISNSAACRRYIEIANLMSGELAAQRRATTGVRGLPARTQENHAAHSLSNDECHSATRMAEALINDEALCERIAQSRKWAAATIRNLALEPSLGWDAATKSLSFLYDTGVKLRKRSETGERVIWWAFGKPSLWRGAYLSQAQTVYLCEGETDAISLIDAGVEAALSTLAVALPSASTFNGEWARLFVGKDVIFALDADTAGQRATERIAALLRPHAKHVRQLKWEGLKDAC